MNFDFSDEQKMLRDHARRFLAETSPLAELRRRLDDSDTPLHAGLWDQCADMGWTGAAIAEDCGGLGLGAMELCVIAEELGRQLTPVPFFSTVCVGAELIKRCAEGARRDELLRRIASGQAIVAVAALLTPGDAAWRHTPLRLKAGRVSGEVRPVADLLAATDLLVAALDEEQQPVIAWIRADDAALDRSEMRGFDLLRPHASLALRDARAETLLTGDAARKALEQVIDQAAVFAAFEQIGTADSALEMARRYSLERFAFGRPIGGNQAVKHRLADMLVKIELARSNAFYGAWACASGPDDLALAAAACRLTATEACDFAAEECLHLHGGIGYTWEADCHFYLRRARLLGVSVGSSGAWADRMIAAAAGAAEVRA